MPYATRASLLALFCLAVVISPAALAQETTMQENLPEVGDEAVDFSLNVSGEERDDEPVEVNLYEQLEKGPVVLLVLRGYPGYQCPICSRQVGQFLRQADEFAKAGASVWMVYPGPAEELDRFAEDFVANRKFPDHFKLLLDPDYGFTNTWHLRWDKPRETAYPSTFVIGTDKEIKFAKISKSHGDRTGPDEVLEAVPTQPES